MRELKRPVIALGLLGAKTGGIQMFCLQGGFKFLPTFSCTQTSTSELARVTKKSF